MGPSCSRCSLSSATNAQRVEHPRWAVREAGEAAKVGATSSEIPGPREISGARCGAPMDSMQTRHVDLGKRADNATG